MKKTFTYSELIHIARKLKKRAHNHIHLVGSLKRKVQEGIKDIDFLTTYSLSRIAKLLRVDTEVTDTQKILRYKYHDVPIEVYYVPSKAMPFAKIHFIGNDIFNMRIRAHAKRQGYKLNQYGLFIAGTNTPVDATFKHEKDIFEFLGFKWKEYTERTVEQKNK